MDKIKFDFDALVTASTRLSEEKDKLKELKTEVDNAMEALRTQGWIGKGEEAFEVIVREQLGIMMEQYADLMGVYSTRRTFPSLRVIVPSVFVKSRMVSFPLLNVLLASLASWNTLTLEVVVPLKKILYVPAGISSPIV